MKIKNKIIIIITTLFLFSNNSVKSYEVTLPNFGFICVNKNNNKKFAKNILNFLAYCDGKRNIFEILEIIKLPAKDGLEIINFCKDKKFI